MQTRCSFPVFPLEPRMISALEVGIRSNTFSSLCWRMRATALIWSQFQSPVSFANAHEEGVLLSQYYGTGHASLDNYIAMIGGQAATPQTRNDCQIYADFVLTGVTSDGQAIGSGCIYPESIKSLPD